MNNNNLSFSNPVRVFLVVVSLLLLQINVPTAMPFYSAFSADFTFNARTRVWQSLQCALASARLHFHEIKQGVALIHDEKVLPATQAPAKTYKIVKVESKKTTAPTSFQWPVKGHISSGFGMRRHPVTYVRSFHNGIDIRAKKGTEILSPADGIVLSAGRAGLLGNMVKIKTDKGLSLYFGHMHKIKCKKGQKISRGQLIGTVGSSGRATGPHLHFSVKADGKYANPVKYLPTR